VLALRHRLRALLLLAGSRRRVGSHRVPGLFHEIIGLLLEDVEEAECRLALRRVGVLVLADLRMEDAGEVRQLPASGLPGNLLGEGIGGVKSGRREHRCHSGCSVKYVGRGHQSEFVHRQ